ncbi:MAG: hypothetical protein QOH91_927 [Mycobacterium sp.]|jgi:hypothetical protein|nr:hypothetical protein [Mycobacterium sp.]
MVTPVSPAERAQIDAVERRLAEKYAEIPHGHVTAVVQHVYARFKQSAVRDYVPLLVERHAREELAKSTGSRETVVQAGCAVTAQ